MGKMAIKSPPRSIAKSMPKGLKRSISSVTRQASAIGKPKGGLNA